MTELEHFKKLKKELQEASELYYQNAISPMSDEEFDMAMKELSHGISSSRMGYLRFFNAEGWK